MISRSDLGRSHLELNPPPRRPPLEEIVGSLTVASLGAAVLFHAWGSPTLAAPESFQGAVPQQLTPPVTRSGDDVDILDGGVRAEDPYRWLEAVDSPEVREWVDKQHAYTQAVTSTLPGLQWFRTELTSLAGDDLRSPIPRGDRLFFLKRSLDQEHPVLWMKAADSEPRILLNPNTWEQEHGRLGNWSASPNGRYVVFSVESPGSEFGTLRVLDVDAGHWTPDDIIPLVAGLAPVWKDERRFLFNRLPQAPTQQDPSPRYRMDTVLHTLGQPANTDVVVAPAQPRSDVWQLGLASSDGAHVVSTVGPRTHNELFWTRTDGSTRPVLITGDIPGTGTKSPVDVVDDHAIVFFSGAGATNGKVIAKDLRSPSPAWIDLVPERADAVLESVTGSFNEGMFVLSYVRDGVSTLEVASFHQPGKTRTVALPGKGSVYGVGGGTGAEFFVGYGDLTHPASILAGSLEGGPLKVHARSREDIGAPRLVVEQVRYPSADGTMVDAFLLQRADADPKKPKPALLFAYGAFGAHATPSDFTPGVAWARAGGIFMLAQIRGGGEQGKAWHLGGTGRNRIRQLEDYHGAARFLIGQGYTRQGDVVAMGASASGNTALWTAAEWPEDFGAVLASAPIADLVRAPLLGMGQLWTDEYPVQPTSGLGYREFSAYHRILSSGLGKLLPPTMITTADNEARVPGHAAKALAALQRRTGGEAYLWVMKGAGHTLASAAFQEQIAMEAATLAFVANRVGLRTPPERTAPEPTDRRRPQ